MSGLIALAGRKKREEEEWAKQEQARVQQAEEWAKQEHERIKKERAETHAEIQRKREEIIEWFEGQDRVHYHTKHQTVVLQRQDGTGMWIYENKSFKAWMDGDRELLWIRGIRTFSSHITRSGILIAPTRSGKREDRSIVCSCR